MAEGCYSWTKREMYAAGRGGGFTQAEAEAEAAANAGLEASEAPIKDYDAFKCPGDCTEKYSTIDKVRYGLVEPLPAQTRHIVNIHIHINLPRVKLDIDLDYWTAAARQRWTYHVYCYNKDQGLDPGVVANPPE